MLSMSGHSAGASLDTVAAGLGTVLPSGPSRHIAVDGASAVGARLSLTEAGASDPAVGSSSGDGAAAGLSAITARDAAFGP
jgi:hypothetical protein